MHRKIRMYTTEWCPDCWRAKQFLKRYGLEFEEINIEKVPDAAEFIMSVNGGRRKVPTFEMEGRTFNCSPFDPFLLRRELGLALE
ncbi:MAG: NrdH-redoxin [Acidobacteria bacterium]|nr:MAG: NrdH-redoxin [Acidobacteriota bacterium]